MFFNSIFSHGMTYKGDMYSRSLSFYALKLLLFPIGQ